MRSSVYLLGCVVVVLCVFGSAAPVSAEVVAHYSFDVDYSDSSGNSYHGTEFDGNYMGEGNPLGDGDTAGVSITTATGKWKFGGGAADFTEERDFVEIPTLSFADGAAYSVAFWACKTSTSWDFFMGKHGESTNVIGRTNTQFKWRGSPSSNNHDFTASGDGRGWHHYVVMAGDFDDVDTTVDEIRLYVDNVLVDTVDGLGTGFIFNAIGEGYAPGSDYDMYGQIDEVWIFNETLNEAQVASLFSGNVVPEPSSLALALGCFVALGFGVRRPRRSRK